jgi:hypothetical protein
MIRSIRERTASLFTKLQYTVGWDDVHNSMVAGPHRAEQLFAYSNTIFPARMLARYREDDEKKSDLSSKLNPGIHPKTGWTNIYGKK